MVLAAGCSRGGLDLATEPRKGLRRTLSRLGGEGGSEVMNCSALPARTIGERVGRRCGSGGARLRCWALSAARAGDRKVAGLSVGVSVERVLEWRLKDSLRLRSTFGLTWTSGGDDRISGSAARAGLDALGWDFVPSSSEGIDGVSSGVNSLFDSDWGLE